MNFSIVLPAYNEAENLPSVLKDLKEVLDGLKISYEIIVVDNGSTDNTQEVLGQVQKEIPQLRIIKLRQNQGFGNGIIQGLIAAQGDVLGFMDADGQIEAKYLSQAYSKLQKENFGLCLGKRIKREDGLSRLFLSKIYNILFKIMFGGNFGDLGAKPKLFTRKFYEFAKPVSKDWFLDTEILIKAIKGKYSAGEIPIISKSRKKGVSKVKISTAFEFLRNMFYWRFFAKY
jgi:glycosyltransferase involved in cell wall biosynthesis